MSMRATIIIAAAWFANGLLWGPLIVDALDDPVEYTIERDCPDANVVLADGHEVARVRFALPEGWTLDGC